VCFSSPFSQICDVAKLAEETRRKFSQTAENQK
jgi:hypothetical protein